MVDCEKCQFVSVCKKRPKMPGAKMAECNTFRQKLQQTMPMTNADRIRAMSDEKMAEAFFNLCKKLNDGTLNDLSNLYCDGENGCIDKYGNITCNPDMEKACVLRLLQSPAKEER